MTTAGENLSCNIVDFSSEFRRKENKLASVQEKLQIWRL